MGGKKHFCFVKTTHRCLFPCTTPDVQDLYQLPPPISRASPGALPPGPGNHPMFEEPPQPAHATKKKTATRRARLRPVKAPLLLKSLVILSTEYPRSVRKYIHLLGFFFCCSRRIYFRNMVKVPPGMTTTFDPNIGSKGPLPPAELRTWYDFKPTWAQTIYEHFMFLSVHIQKKKNARYVRCIQSPPKSYQVTVLVGRGLIRLHAQLQINIPLILFLPPRCPHVQSDLPSFLPVLITQLSVRNAAV